jgi:dipeptidyl-peptidase-3
MFGKDISTFKKVCLDSGVELEDWEKLTAYSAAFYQNCSNFRSFGDTKFVPEFGPAKFKQMMELSPAYSAHKDLFDSIFSKVEKEMFTEAVPFESIGFSDKNGVTGYYSGNVTETEAKMVDEFCIGKNISPLNTRLFKRGDKELEMLTMCAEENATQYPYLGDYSHNGYTIKISAGHLAPFMQSCADHILEAKEYAANDVQKQMMEDYAQHFRYGHVDDHKKSQSQWIKDVGPVVESCIGYIETYADPLGARAQFEGFVALVDKETSAQFNQLVTDAETLIPKLPWAADFEKPVFSKPDFTNLDIVAFACGGTPIGINIPNYDDIRQNEGFKNVNLGNVYPKPNIKTNQFLSKDNANLYVKYSKESLTLIVALHELLGHGTGKLFTKDEKTGELNFDPAVVKNPFNGEEISTYYLSSETWGQKFGKLHSGYEECRADSVAVFLMHFDRPFEIFFPNLKEEWDDIYYVGWMEMLHGAVKGLMFYNPETEVWGQAHILASFAIFSVVRQADPELIKFNFFEKDGKDYFEMQVDRSKLRTVAFEAMSVFLHKLHVYKSMGDFEAGKAHFEQYSKVDEELLRIRSIVLAWKLPRRIELQPNLFLSESGDSVEYRDYSADVEGIV